MQIQNALITGSFSYNGADLSNITSSNAYSASLSTRVSQIETVYATTGSNSFRATQSITGSLTVTGQIIAQTLNVQQVTSSIVFSSGSNNFGCDLNSRQTFTGSVLITGSLIVNTTGPELQVNNNGVILGNLLTDNHSITGSLRISGSGNHSIMGGNVGIGCTLPTYHLEVRCAASTSACYLAAMFSRSTGASDGIGDIIAFGANGVSSIAGMFRTVGGWGLELQTSSQNTRMRIDNCGNVGIGTIAPTNRLTISNNGNSVVAFRINDTNANASFLSLNASNTDSAIIAGGTCAIPFDIYTGGVARLSIGTNGAATICASDTSGNRINPFNTLTITTDNPNLPYGFFGGAILFRNRSYTSGLVESSRIRSVIYDDGAPANCGGGLWFETTRTPGGTLTPSLVINYAGNVGIGTTTPDAYLTICQQCSSAAAATAPYGIYITGREVYNPGSENAGGITIGMGVNRSGNRQLWIKSTDNVVNATNALLRIQPNNQQVAVSSVSTNGDNGTCLALNGSCVTANGVGVGGASDERLKDDIVDLNYGLSSVMCLRPRTFKFKGDCSKTHIGFVAQEVLCVLPNFVVHDRLDDTTVRYGNTELSEIYRLELNGYTWASVLTKAIQEQQCTINALKSCLGIS